MNDFIRQLADEAGQHYTKSSVRLRGSGGKNDGINDMIRRKGGRGSGSLDPESLDAQIRKAAAANNVFGDVDDQIRGSTGRICTGISSGQSPSINTELAGRISQAAEGLEKYGLDTDLADQVSQKIIAARGGNV